MTVPFELGRMSCHGGLILRCQNAPAIGPFYSYYIIKRKYIL
jgi:hypothetical protein